MNVIKANANARPARDDRRSPVAALTSERPRKLIPKNTDSIGSISVNSSLLAKLVLDIEKIIKARNGITANNPMIAAEAGNSEPCKARDKMEPMKKKIIHVEIVNRENARQRLK